MSKTLMTSHTQQISQQTIYKSGNGLNMKGPNFFMKTPQFLELISQFDQGAKSDYNQIFIGKSPSTQSPTGSEKLLNHGGRQQKAPSKKNPNGNQEIAAALKEKLAIQNEENKLKHQMDNMKKAKQQVYQDTSSFDSMSSESWTTSAAIQKETKQYNCDILQNNSSQTSEKKANKSQTDQLKERLELHEQYNQLPRNERNKALLAQKKRDERWDRVPISTKQTAAFTNAKSEEEREAIVQGIQVQSELKEKLNNVLFHNQKQKDAADKKREFAEKKARKEEKFNDLLNQLKESGQTKDPHAKKRNRPQKNVRQQQQIAAIMNDESKNFINGFIEFDDNDLSTSNKPQQQNKRHKNKDADLRDDGEQINLFEKKKNQKTRIFEDKSSKINITNAKSDKSQLKDAKNQVAFSNEPSSNFAFENKRKEKKSSNRSNQKWSGNKTQSFEPYWTLQDTETAIQTGKAFKGVFIANEKCHTLGKLKSDAIEGHIFVNSPFDMNRAMHSSTVGFIIISGDVQSRLKNKSLVKKEEKVEQSKLSQVKEPAEHVDDDNENDWETDSDDDKKVPQKKNKSIAASNGPVSGRIVARIVHIFENPYATSPIVGYLKPIGSNDIPKSKDKKRKGEFLAEKPKKKYWFIPKFSKLPYMIPLKQSIEFEKEINDRAIDITTQYVSAIFKKWSENQSHAECELQKCLGTRGDIEIECETLLEEFQVYNEEFTPETEEYLSSFREQLNDKGEYIIPETEREKRWDLTSEIICTIDPPDARDLDDALSVKHLRDDIYEIGVHIADVSHFVQANTPIDEDARLRTTSVYLVHRVIPMLPRLLCENLCSLNPNVERLAFTVFFEMKSNGEVLWDGPIRIGKSIINSCSKLSYDTVQLMIENKIKNPTELPVANQPREGVDRQKMFDNILLLSKLGMKRREKRFSEGVFSIESLKKRFKLDEKFWPISYSIEERKDANFVVEEFMLLANQLIGKAMVQKCESLAVLRQHRYPSVEKQTQLNVIAQEFKHKVNFTSLKTINESINKIKNDPSISFEKKLFLKRQMFLVLEQAAYFVADQLPQKDWHHFALNFDVYTHFTSPIRRYPDLLVHRTMFAILQDNKQALDEIDQESLLEIMELCNQNKAKSKKVSDGCQKIFMCLYLKTHSVESKAMVVSFGQMSMTIFIPDYEIQTTFFFQDYKDIKKVNTEKNTNQLNMVYRTKKMRRENTVSFVPYSPITVSLTSTDSFPIDYKITITLPDPDDKLITHVIS